MLGRTLLEVLTHKCLFLQLWSGAIEHEHRLDVVIEQLADAIEEHDQVSIRDRLPTAITKSLHSLVQPNTHI